MYLHVSLSPSLVFVWLIFNVLGDTSSSEQTAHWGMCSVTLSFFLFTMMVTCFIYWTFCTTCHTPVLQCSCFSFHDWMAVSLLACSSPLTDHSSWHLAITLHYVLVKHFTALSLTYFLLLTSPAPLQLWQGRWVCTLHPVWRWGWVYFRDWRDNGWHPRHQEFGPREKVPVRPARKGHWPVDKPLTGGRVRVHHQGPGC